MAAPIIAPFVALASNGVSLNFSDFLSCFVYVGVLVLAFRFLISQARSHPAWLLLTKDELKEC